MNRMNLQDENANLGYISEIIVDYQMRGTGSGTEKIQSAIKLAQDRGCTAGVGV